MLTPEQEAGYRGLGWEITDREPSPDQLKVLQLKLRQPLPTLSMKAPQILGTNFLRTHPKSILSMDKGMGKTVVYLCAAFNGYPEYVIICCPTNAMAAQRREILRHFPFYADKFIFVRGQAHQRWKQWRTPGVRVFICTMATLQTDIGGRVLNKASGSLSESIVPDWVLSTALDHLSLDEFQKYIRRRSKTLDQLKKLSPETLYLDSGSPVSKGPEDLWPALHLVDRKHWSSYWRYVGTFCELEDSYFGKGKRIIGPKNVDNWRLAVAPYVFHRKKDPRDYPPKSRFFLDVDLEPWQRRLHDEIRQNLMVTVGTDDAVEIIVAQNKLDALYRARLALICPKVLDPNLGYGAGLEGIGEDAEDLTHFVISTPFRAPLPYMQEYFRGLGRKVWTLAGGLGIDPDTQDRIIKEFEEQGGVLLQTIKYATSYEFLVPEHNYFLGYEYDPEDNKQAEDRMQRLSSTRPSFHWYVRHSNTYDEDLVTRLVEKANNTRILMDRGRDWDKGDW